MTSAMACSGKGIAMSSTKIAEVSLHRGPDDVAFSDGQLLLQRRDRPRSEQSRDDLAQFGELGRGNAVEQDVRVGEVIPLG